MLHRYTSGHINDRNTDAHTSYIIEVLMHMNEIQVQLLSSWLILPRYTKLQLLKLFDFLVKDVIGPSKEKNSSTELIEL